MGRIRKTAALVAIALSIACGGAPTPPPPTPQTLGGEFAPYPYTVSQIRAGCHDRTIEYRIEKAGAPPTTERWVFSDLDPQTVNVTTTTFDADGKEIVAPRAQAAKWTDLHEHARFPRAATAIDDDTIALPAGTFNCMRYIVTTGDEVKTVWFARNVAGPPVKLVVTKGGQLVMMMTMQANRSK